MNKLTVFTHGDTLVTDSRDVAAMVGKDHNKLLRDIRTYCGYIGQSKIGQSEFFIESTYRNSQNKEQPCYFLTRKGCDMVANKMTGEKGVLFTAAYVDRFYAMENHIKVQVSEIQRLEAEAKATRARAMDMNAKTRALQAIMKTTDNKNLSHIALEVYGLKAVGAVTGADVGNLLPETEKTYSATEVGEMFGVTANKIGSLANKNGLKTDQFGITVLDKSRYSSKEVPAFRYNQRGVDAIGKIIEEGRS